jgi:histone deacetylase 1/2
LLQDNNNNNYQSSANSASRGRGNHRGRGGNGGRGSHGGRGFLGQGGRGNGAQKQQRQGNSASKPVCQICGKGNHEAADCWHRYDEAYQGSNSKVAGSASTGYGVDTNWYVDSGASDHITSELEKLTVRDKYHGQDQVHTANGSGMKIVALVIQFYTPRIKT